jgi:hypothetical protein
VHCSIIVYVIETDELEVRLAAAGATRVAAAVVAQRG